jgi:short-subunit dehydrogenase
VDYLAQVALTKTVLPIMEGLDEARIINIGSVASKIGVPVRTAYCGAKHALLGYMDALRTETVLTGHSHIHILNIILGSTSTSLTTRAVVGMSREGVTPEVFSGLDPNIEGGMNACIVANRILSISHRKSTTEAWIAQGKEYLILVLNQYIPKTALIILTRSAGRQYVVKSANADTARVKCE